MSGQREDAGADGGMETVALDQLVAQHFRLEHAGDKLAVKNDLKTVCMGMGIDRGAVPAARVPELLAEYRRRYCAPQEPPRQVTGAITATGMPSALASTGMPTAFASTETSVTTPAEPTPDYAPEAADPQAGSEAQLANLEEAKRILLEEHGMPSHGSLPMMLAYRVFCHVCNDGEYRAVVESAQSLSPSYIGRSVATFVSKVREFCAERDCAMLDDPGRSQDRNYIWDVTTRFREACYASEAPGGAPKAG